MAWVGGGGMEGVIAEGSFYVWERVLAGWFTSLPATWSRGELDSGGLLSISSLFMCLILIGFRSSFWFVFLIIFYHVTTCLDVLIRQNSNGSLR